MILIGVLIVIAIRKIINLTVPIWVIMTIGALLTLGSFQITPIKAIQAINVEIILYLFGVFTICQAAESSGYLEQLTDRLFYYSNTGKQALLLIIFVLGFSSALLMNDTIAIVGTPIILQLCKAHKNLTKPLLLALAYAITIGSVITPIGNPQNLLIAIKGDMASPFLSFIKILIIPTIINLIITYIVIYFCFRKVLNETIEKPQPSEINDHRTVKLVKMSLILMVLIIAIKIISDHFQILINFSYIALVPAFLLLCFSPKRWEIFKKIDWGTLIFFVSMFILMQSVWDSDFFQNYIHLWKIKVTQTHVILSLSVILSQFISNVPLVALYLPLLTNHTLQQMNLLALAVGSTIAGNLTLLGAASNIIILQNAEKRNDKGFGFFEFSLIGIPLTIINLLIYLLFL